MVMSVCVMWISINIGFHFALCVFFFFVHMCICMHLYVTSVLSLKGANIGFEINPQQLQMKMAHQQPTN